MALSDATGDPTYGERSEGVIRMLMEARAAAAQRASRGIAR
jgi:hypothetical protein